MRMEKGKPNVEVNSMVEPESADRDALRHNWQKAADVADKHIQASSKMPPRSSKKTQRTKKAQSRPEPSVTGCKSRSSQLSKGVVSSANNSVQQTPKGPISAKGSQSQGFVIQSPSRQGKRGTAQPDGNKLYFMNPTFEKWDPDPSNQVAGVGVT